MGLDYLAPVALTPEPFFKLPAEVGFLLDVKIQPFQLLKIAVLIIDGQINLLMPFVAQHTAEIIAAIGRVIGILAGKTAF